MNVHLDHDEITALLQTEAFSPPPLANSLFLVRPAPALVDRPPSVVHAATSTRILAGSDFAIPDGVAERSPLSAPKPKAASLPVALG